MVLNGDMTLTKDDFNQIGKIVKGSEVRIKKDVTSQLNGIKKEIKTEIRKVQKSLEGMDKFLDTEVMSDRNRIIEIEEHLNLPQN